MSSDQQIVVFDNEIVDWHRGHIQAQALPVCSVVERHVETRLSSGIEQAASDRVLADYTSKVVVRYAGRNLRPGLTIIIGFVEIGLEIVLFVTGGGKERAGRIVGRGPNDPAKRPFAQSARVNILPVLAAILQNVRQAIT